MLREVIGIEDDEVVVAAWPSVERRDEWALNVVLAREGDSKRLRIVTTKDHLPHELLGPTLDTLFGFTLHAVEAITNAVRCDMGAHASLGKTPTDALLTAVTCAFRVGRSEGGQSVMLPFVGAALRAESGEVRFCWKPFAQINWGREEAPTIIAAASPALRVFTAALCEAAGAKGSAP